MKKFKLRYKTFTWFLIGLMYLPIYVIAWLLRIVARILLAISYIGTLNVIMGIEVFKSIFSWDYERAY